MIAFYNDLDPYCCAWLRNLIDAGEIMPGVVDNRSITEIDPDELKAYTQVHLFAGLGGWALAARRAGWPDDRPLWTGSCPCQPFSVAGLQLGVADERHLWPYVQRFIAACRPSNFVGEQVAGAVGCGWIDSVLFALENLYYSCRAVIVPACAVNAPHRRDRIWIFADAQRDEQSREKSRLRKVRRMGGVIQPFPWDRGWKNALRSLRVVDDGVQRCLAATDAARNAIVPQIATEILAAWLDVHPDY